MKKVKEKIIELADAEEWNNLEEFILKNQPDTKNLLKKSLFSREGPHLLGNILKPLQCKTNASTTLKSKIYESVLNLVKCNEDADENENGKLITVLIMHVDSFPNSILVNLINIYMDHLDSEFPFYGRWADLLSKLLSTCVTREDLKVDGETMSGDDFQYHILKRICGFKWDAQTTTTLLQILKELNIPKEEMRDVISKLRRVLRELDIQSVPPIVYHMILLGQGTLPGTVLEVVMQFFNEREEAAKKREDEGDDDGISDAQTTVIFQNNSLADLLEAQGTVILHITHLAQYDPRLIKDYLKVIKCTWLPRRLFTPFNLALALSLAQIDRYKDQILDSLKSCILKHFRTEEKRRKSCWLSDAFEGTLDLMDVFRGTVTNCKGGWDQVSEGLVSLCWSLLECGGGVKGESSPFAETVGLACSVLPLVFKKEPRLASGIVRQLSTLIFTASASMQYVDLLGRLVKASPVCLLDHVSLIRDLLEQVAFLPLRVGASLLSVLLPLIKMSMTLKDALVIILRKMLFSKQVSSRELSVLGFVQILRHFRVMGALPSSQASLSFSSTLSQVSADVHSDLNANTNEAVCLELLGVLRRALTQQSQVRSRVYTGLYDVTRANPKLASSILQLLHQHLSSFLDRSTEALNPILLGKTVTVKGDASTLVEPLGELVSCLSKSKIWYENYRGDGHEEGEDEEEEAVSCLNDVCTTFDLLSDKLAYCDMDDLDLGSASFVQGTPTGRQNLFYAEIMIGVYDALMDQNFCKGALKSEEQMKLLLALFKTQRKIVDLVKERSKPGKKGESSKGKGRPASTKQVISFKSVLSLDVAVRVLKVSLNGEESADQRCVELVQGNRDLQLYLISIVDQTAAELKEMLPGNRDKILPNLKIVGHLLLKECWSSLTNVIEDDDEREVLRVRQCLTTLHSLLVAFVKFYKDKLPQIFKELTGKSPSKEYGSLLLYVAKSCCKMLLKILHNENQNDFNKDSTLLIQIISLVTQQMDRSSKELNDVQEMVNQICKDQPIENSSVAESLIKLLLALTDRVKASSNIIRSVARELHYRMGDVEQDVVVEEQGNYKIVTESSASPILTTLCSYCDETLSILELSLNILKAALLAGEKYKAEKLDKMISLKFAVITHALHEVFQSAIPHGTPQDAVLKTTTKFYNCMSMFVKYYLQIYRTKDNATISENFEKLIHLCANMLKEYAYKMINYVHNTQLQTGKKTQVSLAARALKESKLIPALVYSMEQYENQLMQLAKKSKVNLLAGTKMATSRDFRIVLDTLQDVMRRTAVEEGDGEEEEEEQEQEEPEPMEEEVEERERSPPPKKKKKK